jgi:hypothetical protein
MAMDPLVQKTFSLSDLVHLFSISFRLKPAYGGFDGGGPEAGCEVELIGQHHGRRKHMGDKCPRCLELLLLLLEIEDFILSGGASVWDFHAQCQKVIRYASTPGDQQHEVVVDVKIIRSPTLQPVPDDWRVKLSEEIRAELQDLGCREVTFMPLPTNSLADQVWVRR